MDPQFIEDASLAIETAEPSFVRTLTAGGMTTGRFALPSGSSAARYLSHLDAIASEGQATLDYLEVTPPPQGPRPFLTVLVRTQGNRPEELTDTLLCLMGQLDDDFEVVLVGHNVTPGRKEVLAALAAEQPRFIRERLRIVWAEGGTRATPLQVGFSVARGAYISCYDDDDVVMDDWVSTFHEAARSRPGALVHAYGVTQPWSIAAGGNDPDRHVMASTDAYNANYCVDFDAAFELSDNMCPFCTIAFPTYLYQDLNIRFNDDRFVTEDWEYLVRCYGVAGIVDVPRVTSIYRRWTNAENSGSLHSRAEWEKVRQDIMKGFGKAPFLIDGPGVADIQAKSLQGRSTPSALLHTSHAFTCEGYGSAIEGILHVYEGSPTGLKGPFANADLRFDEWNLAYDLEGSEGPWLCVVLRGNGCCVAMDASVRVVFSDGVTCDLDASQARHDGFVRKAGEIIFLRPCPFLLWKLPRQVPVDEVLFSLDFDDGLSLQRANDVGRGKLGMRLRGAYRYLVDRFELGKYKRAVKDNLKKVLRNLRSRTAR